MRGYLTIALAGLLAVAGPSAAQMTLTGAGGTQFKSSGTAFSLTYQSSNGVNSGASTTVDYGTLSYGSGNTRVIVLATWGQASGETISGVTIGGVALTQISGAFSTVGGSGVIGASDIWMSTAPLAGTSGDVRITYSATPGSGITGVALYNLQTTTPTPAHVANTTAFNSPTASTAITVPSGGAAIAITATWGFAASSVSFTAGATQDANFPLPIFSNPVLVGHTTSTGSVTVTATYNANAGAPMSLVSWGP